MLFKIIKKILNYFKSKLFSNAIILLYHRVDDVKHDPHLLSVSKANFYQQIKFLSEHYKLVTMNELVDLKRKKEPLNRYVAITFDDGYVDNFLNALPVLQEFNVPATIFVVAGQIDSSEPYYWEKEVEKADVGRAVRVDELKKMVDTGLIEIGSHTINHPHLSHESVAVQREEILKSKLMIEKKIGFKISGFSYPFGGYQDATSKTVAIVKEAGYNYACMAFGGNTFFSSDEFQLPRQIVRNWDLSTFVQKMKHFL